MFILDKAKKFLGLENDPVDQEGWPKMTRTADELASKFASTFDRNDRSKTEDTY